MSYASYRRLYDLCTYILLDYIEFFNFVSFWFHRYIYIYIWCIIFIYSVELFNEDTAAFSLSDHVGKNTTSKYAYIIIAKKYILTEKQKRIFIGLAKQNNITCVLLILNITYTMFKRHRERGIRNMSNTNYSLLALFINVICYEKVL